MTRRPGSDANLEARGAGEHEAQRSQTLTFVCMIIACPPALFKGADAGGMAVMMFWGCYGMGYAAARWPLSRRRHGLVEVFGPFPTGGIFLAETRLTLAIAAFTIFVGIAMTPGEPPKWAALGPLVCAAVCGWADVVLFAAAKGRWFASAPKALRRMVTVHD